MSALVIPHQNISDCETDFDRINLLKETGLQLDINQLNWADAFPKTFPVSVHVAHDNQKIYLYYQVYGEELRAVNTKDFMSIWEDSCVEFFVQRKGQESYRNFEFNVHGVLLASNHESREFSQKLSQELMSSIERLTTIKHQYRDGAQVSDWTLFAAIPKEAIGFSTDEEMSQQKIGANFYKCGDKTNEPHFISWSPIETPKPSFHVPQFFGDLIFE